MDNQRKLKRLKEEADELFGDGGTELLRDILSASKRGNEEMVEKLSKIDFKGITAAQKVWFKELIDVTRDNKVEFPKSFEVIEKNPVKEVAVSNLKDIPKPLSRVEITNLKDIPTPKDPLEEVTVKNLKDLKIPKKVTLKKPLWYKAIKLGGVNKRIDKLTKTIKGGAKVDLDEYRNANRPLAVRLSNGKKFYSAFMQAIAAGGAAFPFKNTHGNAQEALVDLGGHLQVDVLSDPSSSAATTPTVFNTTLTVADTEYSIAIPTGTDKFTFQCRTAFDVRWAFEAGKVATSTEPYFTLKAGQNHYEDGLKLTGKTIYLASSTAGVVVELVTWS